LGKESKTDIDCMTLHPHGRAILLMSIRARDEISYDAVFEEGIQLLVLPSPIRLHGRSFTIKESLN
jgi:hypothetical protein